MGGKCYEYDLPFIPHPISKIMSAYALPLYPYLLISFVSSILYAQDANEGIILRIGTI